ncbi:hypothetical protein DC345_27335 [Paenibacillus taichungensis]|uniref:Uncharacterized protein n=1 Tax=Paenibacillus taichungensis TaxID=484184 RepID=A0A329QEA8_9BACL|nr:hypothetical protein DC345_27335 [Paenibacillus taichungensis]
MQLTGAFRLTNSGWLTATAAKKLVLYCGTILSESVRFSLLLPVFAVFMMNDKIIPFNLCVAIIAKRLWTDNNLPSYRYKRSFILKSKVD